MPNGGVKVSVAGARHTTQAGSLTLALGLGKSFQSLDLARHWSRNGLLIHVMSTKMMRQILFEARFFEVRV